MSVAAHVWLPLLLLLTAAAPCRAAPAPSAACSAAEHHQFDFWIGSWRVTQHGKLAGHSRVDALLDGCALLENWTGKGGSRGHSLNFYDPQRHLWQQTWIDNGAEALNLAGGLDHGGMLLSGTRVDARTRRTLIDRIAWTLQADGSVRQLWDQSHDQGRSWQVLFDGRYQRE